MGGEAWPVIEYDDCYPVDEDFKAFADLPLSFKLAGDWLLSELHRACKHMCCSCDIRRGKNIVGKPVWLIHFSTGGWSGAESIIALISRRVDLKYHMLSWRRGGHYVFEVAIEPVAIKDVRAQAWATRRAKYGPRGHSGSYAR